MDSTENLLQNIQNTYNNFYDSIHTLSLYLKESKELLENNLEEKTKLALKVNMIYQGEEIQPEHDSTSKIEFTEDQWGMIVEGMNRLVQISDKYPSMLFEMSFIYLVALFDAYLLDVLYEVLIYKPEILKSSKKQLSYELILNLKNTNELITYLVQKELNELGYKSIIEQAEYYVYKLNIKIADSGIALDDLAEIRAARNLLIHNKGLVNSIYLETVQTSKYKAGERVVINLEYWNNCYEKLNQVSEFIRDSILSKFT